MAARRPWVVIGSWVLLAVVVVGASSTSGTELEDSFRVPGLDSQIANDLLAEAGSDQAGPTAQVVVTPADDEATLFDSAAARDALADLQTAARETSNVLSTSDPSGALAAGSGTEGLVSPDGRVALLRIQYPLMEDLSVADRVRHCGTARGVVAWTHGCGGRADDDRAGARARAG